VLPLAICVLAAGAGLAFGGNTVNDLVGAALVVAIIGLSTMFVRSKRRIAAALSRRYGLRIGTSELPVMTPRRFDAWRDRRDLRPVATDR
jgi:hypothetical protein